MRERLERILTTALLAAVLYAIVVAGGLEAQGFVPPWLRTPTPRATSTPRPTVVPPFQPTAGPTPRPTTVPVSDDCPWHRYVATPVPGNNVTVTFNDLRCVNGIAVDVSGMGPASLEMATRYEDDDTPLDTIGWGHLNYSGDGCWVFDDQSRAMAVPQVGKPGLEIVIKMTAGAREGRVGYVQFPPVELKGSRLFN